MARFNAKQQRAIDQGLQALTDADLRYVIPRGFKNLPESVPGTDIDILVHDDDIEDTKRALGNAGFAPHEGISNIEHLLNVARTAVEDPKKAIKKLRSDPREVVELLIGPDRSSISLRNMYNEFKLEKEGVVFHLFNHLAYTSPMFDVKVRVHPSVEIGMLERRTWVSNYFVADPADELAHLICRGIFDKGGQFPSYYKERCDVLWEEIQGNDEQRDIFKPLLSNIFYQADTVVLKCIKNSTYDSLKHNLLKYTDY